MIATMLTSYWKILILDRSTFVDLKVNGGSLWLSIRLFVILALIAMVSPISNFLLWLGPFFTKGSYVEWFMLGFHLIFPSILLAAFWRGRVKYPVTLKGDFPLFAVIVLFHLYDIISAITGGFYDILWLVLLASLVHFGLLGLIWYRSKKSPMLIENDFFYEP